jgi:phosphopantetheine adenylyltransferase
MKNFTYLNSSIVKEVAKHKGDIRDFVPKNIYKRLAKKYNLL